MDVVAVFACQTCDAQSPPRVCMFLVIAALAIAGYVAVGVCSALILVNVVVVIVRVIVINRIILLLIIIVVVFFVGCCYYCCRCVCC